MEYKEIEEELGTWKARSGKWEYNKEEIIKLIKRISIVEHHKGYVEGHRDGWIKKKRSI